MAGQIPPPAKFSWIGSSSSPPARRMGLFSTSRNPGSTARKCCCAPAITTVGDIEMVSGTAARKYGSPRRCECLSFLEMTGVKSRRAAGGNHAAGDGQNGFAAAWPLPHRVFAARALLHHAGTAPPRRRNRPQTQNCASRFMSPNPTRSLTCSRTAAARCSTGWPAAAATCPTAASARPSSTSNATACSAKICSPSTSIISRPATPRCSASRKVSVVHCPRSHAYFRHQKFPLAANSPLPASISASAPTASPASITSANKPSNSTCSRKCAQLAASEPGVSPQNHLANGHRQRRPRPRPAGQVGELSPRRFRRSHRHSFHRQNLPTL